MVGHLRLNPMKPLGISDLRWTFCDRQPSVQSLCSVRVEGNYNGPWEEAHRGSFFRAKRTDGFLDLRSYTVYNSSSTCFPTMLYACFLHDGNIHFFKTQWGGHLLIATVLFNCFVGRIKLSLCRMTKRGFSKTLAP